MRHVSAPDAGQVAIEPPALVRGVRHAAGPMVLAEKPVVNAVMTSAVSCPVGLGSSAPAGPRQADWLARVGH